MLRVCVFVRALVCMCRVGPCAKGPEKPGLRVVGETAQEPWKVLEQGGGSETRDGGRERAEWKVATELVGWGLGAPRGFASRRLWGKIHRVQWHLNAGIQGGGRGAEASRTEMLSRREPVEVPAFPLLAFRILRSFVPRG